MMIPPVKRLLLAVLICLGLSASPATFAGGQRGDVRPAAKGASVGSMGKDYVFLAAPCNVTSPMFGTFRAVMILPAGQYRLRYEDNLGFYLPAPGLIQEAVGDRTPVATVSAGGGFYIRKDRPEAVYLYRTAENGRIVPPNLSAAPLGREVTSRFRQ